MTWKILKNTKSFQFQSQKKLKGLVKMGNKLGKPYPTNYNLLIAHDLWQAHYQILLIILLKEFIKLNENISKIIKNAKRVKLNTDIVTAVLIHKL